MKKILIIEDTALVQKIYRERLTREGFEVVEARTAADGLRLAKESKPDLIILDILLPDNLEGLDLLKQFKADETLASVPVIVLTNLDTLETTARQLGAVDYCVKAQVSIERVVEKIKLYIAASS